MNTTPQRFASQRGSALITAALASGVLAIMVAGYLSLLSNEYLLNLRSHVWNSALHLAEAGVEVGYAEMNYQYYQGSAGFTSARGWSTISAGNYTKTVTNFSSTTGSVIGTFVITVNGACMAGCNPTITSIATCTTTPHGPQISRAVLTRLKSVTQWPSALLSKNWINMNGNNIYSDSYDSSDPTKSTGGLYDSAKRQANGNVASNGTIKNTVNVGNADIYGVAYTGPGGSVAMGANGSIGPTFVDADRATTVSQATGNGWIQSDFNVDVPNPILPAGATSWSGAPNSMTTGSGIGTISKAGTLNSGSYRANGLTLNSSEQLTINGNVELYINGNVQLSGSSRILINSNASLTVYVSGSVSVAGNGVINNTVRPLQNKWYGLSTSTSWSISGNGQWIGAIYAPNASFTMNGGGSAGDMSGAVVANTITLNGHVKFHYDEVLGRADTGAGYACTSWQELRRVNGSWVP